MTNRLTSIAKIWAHEPERRDNAEIAFDAILNTDGSDPIESIERDEDIRDALIIEQESGIMTIVPLN
jgi:antitoxin (DNA-binding transcriptional repressor) of toxin-antitoxin stability system